MLRGLCCPRTLPRQISSSHVVRVELEEEKQTRSLDIRCMWVYTLLFHFKVAPRRKQRFMCTKRCPDRYSLPLCNFQNAGLVFGFLHGISTLSLTDFVSGRAWSDDVAIGTFRGICLLDGYGELTKVWKLLCFIFGF